MPDPEVQTTMGLKEALSLAPRSHQAAFSCLFIFSVLVHWQTLLWPTEGCAVSVQQWNHAAEFTQLLWVQELEQTWSQTVGLWVWAVLPHIQREKSGKALIYLPYWGDNTHVCAMRLSKPLQIGLWKSDSLYKLMGVTNLDPLLTECYIISPLFLLHLSDIAWEYDMVLWFIWYC